MADRDRMGCLDAAQRRAIHRFGSDVCLRVGASDHIVVNMTDQQLLGDFELMVMIAVTRLGDEAFAVPVRELIESEADRAVSRGALYTTLDRLERKGLLASRLGDPLAERGGRARRYYEPTAAGRESLERTRHALETLWRGLGEPARGG